MTAERDEEQEEQSTEPQHAYTFVVNEQTKVIYARNRQEAEQQLQGNDNA